MTKKYACRALATLSLLVVATWLAFLRNPIALTDPVMFTEDGTWAAALYTRGVVSTYFGARPDYLVVANVLMLHLASLIAEAMGAGLVGTPPVIAFLSYLFYGGVAAFSSVALRDHLPTWARSLAVLLIALVPVGVPQSSAEIWGRASNIGFAFAYVAVLAIIWRESLIARGHSRWVVVADFLIVLSCATNPIALPIACSYLGYRFWRHRFIRNSRSDWCLAVFLALIAFRVFLGTIGMPNPEEDTTVERNWSNFFLSAASRPLLYPFLFPVYHRLTHEISIVALAFLTIFLTLAFCTVRKRHVYAFFILCTVFVTIAIAVQRPLLPQQMGGYTGTYPDRYFYAQNIMILLAAVWGAASLRTRFQQFALSAAPALALVLLFIFNLPRIIIPSQVPCPPEHHFASQVAAGVPIAGRADVIAVEICPPTWFIEFPLTQAGARHTKP